MQSNQNLKLYFLLISFNIFFSIHAHAGNYTWIGSDDPTWYRSTNWSPGGIPGASDTVTISSTAAYNLTLDSSKTVYRFIISGDTVDFGGKILTVSGSSSLSGGYLTNGTIEARGGSVTFSGTIFNVTVSAICTSVLFNGSTFNQPVSGEITGSSAYTSSGGNTFNSTFTVINGTSNGTVNLANTSGDYFNGKVTVVNTGRNSINFALNDTTFFNDSIVVNSTSGGVAFGSANGIAVLASGKQLVVGNTGFSKGTLLLNRFIQSGSTAQSLSLTGSAIISLISSTFNGTVTYSAPGILVKKSTFNSAVYFTKTDSVSNVWYGENTYNGVFRFTNNGSGSVQMQTTARDIFADSVTINAGSASFSGAVKNGPETGDVTVFYGSLYTTGSTLTFGSGDGTLKFTGTAGQVIKGSVTLPVINMIVDKSSGMLTLQAPVTISNNLDLTNGILVTDTTNMITLLHGATCSNASASSYVSGPMKKTGDAAFTFPVGKGGDYNHTSISAPASSTDAFMAEYFVGVNPLGYTMDSLLENISECGYWKITRTSGTSNVKITLGWDAVPCRNYNSAYLKMARWGGSSWINIENDTLIGNTNNQGTITTKNTVSAFDYFIIAPANAHITIGFAGTPRNIEHFYGVNMSDNYSDPESALDLPAVQDVIPALSPSTLRYYSGIPANWWDWKNNRFMHDHTINGQPYFLPEKFHNLYGVPNGFANSSIEDFYNGVYRSAAKPIYCFNSLSSDVFYQMASLYDAEGNNIPVRMIELGNELYSEENYNDVRFPTGTEYADLAIEWIGRIKAAFPPGFDHKIGLCAYEYDPNKPPSRGTQWNKKLFDRLDAVNTEFPDAIIIHKYAGAGLAANDPLVPKCNVNPCGPKGPYVMRSPFELPVCTNDMKIVFRKPFIEFFGTSANGGFIDLELDAANPSVGIPSQYDIWITEHNNNDVNTVFHGSWAHGLTAALNSMLFLESERITKVSLFSLIGDAIYASYYGDSTGFNYEKDTEGKHKAPRENAATICTGDIVKTMDYSPTAVGHTIGMLARATRNATQADQLNFTATSGVLPDLPYKKPNTSVNIPALYGWSFQDDATSPAEFQAIILNLSNEAVNIENTSLTDYEFFEQVYCDPAAFITGMTADHPDGAYNEQPGHPLEVMSLQQISGTITTIEPYSIMRLYKYNDVIIKALSDNQTVCQGTTGSLVAIGDPGLDYSNWTCSNTTEITNLAVLPTPTGATLTFDVDPGFSGSVTFKLEIGPTTYPFDITISERPVLEFTVNAITNPDNILLCKGSALDLEAASNSTTWDHFIFINSLGEGIGETSSDNQILSVIAEQSAKYYVYTYDGVCSAIASVEVFVPEIDLGDDVYVCSGTNYTFTDAQIPDFSDAPGFSQVDYLWSNGNTTAHPAFTVSGTTTYTVTVTLTASATCTLTDEITLYPAACCTTTPDVTLENISVLHPDFEGLFPGEYTLSADGSTIIINNNGGAYEINLNGRLTIEGKNLKLVNCTLRVGEGAEIFVGKHHVLNLTRTQINPCDKMWKGINLMEHAKLVSAGGTSDRNEINGAEFGLLMHYRSEAEINKTDFKNNYISVMLPPAITAVGNKISKFNFSNTTFSCTGCGSTPLPGSYNGQTTTPGNYSFAGMVLNDMAGTIGVDGAGTVEFSELNNGIIAMNSSLLVENTTFTTMKAFDAYSLPLNGVTGTGIFAGADAGKHGFLYQRGLGISTISATPPLTFNDCVRGIHTNNTSADISLNQMDEISNVGIYCENGRYADINVSTNQIKSYFIGMHFSNNRASASFNVKQNEVGIGTLYKSITVGQIGILVDEIPSHFLFKAKGYNILCNQIKDNFFSGMQMTGLHPLAFVKNNTINMSDFTMPNSIGMDFSAVDAMTINSNSVYGDDITIGSAYHFSLNNNPLVSDNISNGSRYGFDFQGANTNTRFITNNIGFLDLVDAPYHDIGLHLHDFTIIGQQFRTVGTTTTVFNNQWVEDPNDQSIYGQLHGGAQNDFNSLVSAAQSQFKVPDASMEGDVDYPYNFCAGPGAWFFPETHTVAIPSGYDFSCEVFPRPENIEITVLDSLIAYDSISTEIFEPETKFILASDLFDKLAAHPELMEGDSLLTAFYDSREHTILGQLSSVRSDIEFILDEDTNVINEIGLNDSLIKGLHEYLSVIDTLIESGGAEADSLSLLDSAKEVIGQIANYMQKQNELIGLLDNERQAKIDSAVSHNGNITATETIEINEKTINGIYLDKIIYNNYNLDSAQLANLDFIAPQCPFSGGRAVYTARVIKRMLGDTAVYNDSLACAGIGFRITTNTKMQNSSFISVSPNPLNESCTFYYLLPENTQGKIEILDLVGKSIDVIEAKANSKITFYNTSRLNSGLYQYRLISEKKVIGYGKMAVVK